MKQTFFFHKENIIVIADIEKIIYKEHISTDRGLLVNCCFDFCLKEIIEAQNFHTDEIIEPKKYHEELVFSALADSNYNHEAEDVDIIN